jgi:deoxyribonuclease-4
MRIGLHVPVAAGYDAAVAYARSAGCTSVQFFAGNPKTYRTTAIDRTSLERFRGLRAEADLDPAVIHTSYLINLASEDPKIVANSLRLLKADLAFADAGGVRFVNTHLGSYGKRPRSEGFAQVAGALEEALAQIGPDVVLVLENSAGAGQLCGGTVEELGEFMRALDHPQLGVCIDTAHSWAAGYEIDTQPGVDRFIALIAEHVSLERLHLFHFNDTQVPLGGHRDRHWHIGEGLIGFEGFRALAARPELRGKTAILETPGEEADDRRNMQTIRMIFEGVTA